MGSRRGPVRHRNGCLLVHLDLAGQDVARVGRTLRGAQLDLGGARDPLRPLATLNLELEVTQVCLPLLLLPPLLVIKVLPLVLAKRCPALLPRL